MAVRWRSSTLLVIGVWFALEIFSRWALGSEPSEATILLLRYARILLLLAIIVLLIAEENFPVALLFGVFLFFALSSVGSKVTVVHRPSQATLAAQKRSQEVVEK